MLHPFFRGFAAYSVTRAKLDSANFYFFSNIPQGNTFVKTEGLPLFPQAKISSK